MDKKYFVYFKLDLIFSNYINDWIKFDELLSFYQMVYLNQIVDFAKSNGYIFEIKTMKDGFKGYASYKMDIEELILKAEQMFDIQLKIKKIDKLA